MKRGVGLNTFKSHRVSTQQVKKKCVIPVKTGIQFYGLFLDSRWSLPRTPIRGGNDDLKCFHRKIAKFRFYLINFTKRRNDMTSPWGDFRLTKESIID